MKNFMLPAFVEICKLDQKELHAFLKSYLIDLGYEIYDDKKWLLGLGGNILLTAHMDTVHKEKVSVVEEKIIQGKHILTSPQGIGGDDRCGIYIILRLLEEGHRPTVLFTEDEELGGIGAEEFCKAALDLPILESIIKSCGYMIELDRANSKDAVFYNCDNPEFTKFITESTGYKEEWGTFSDISVLAPTFERAAVNLSCGYYKPHTLEEYVVLEEMLHTYNVVKKLLEKGAQKFEYIEGKYSLLDQYYGRDYKGWYDDVCLMISFCRNGEMEYSEHYGYDEYHAMCDFFQANPDICWNDIIDVDMC